MYNVGGIHFAGNRIEDSLGGYTDYYLYDLDQKGYRSLVMSLYSRHLEYRIFGHTPHCTYKSTFSPY